ncbi:hypothetical protein PQI66_10085 [Corynebacterium sp. USCH3]|uniref:hypothetical protein n=1 Tax=Corynebacterium sp. USCH3 TaxID=3024840 RepID=UPI0030B396E0
MSNPSDPHRHHGDDRPSDTDAFEDTEFSMDDGSARAPEERSGDLEGYEAEVEPSGDRPDGDHQVTGGGAGDAGEVIDAESTEVADEPLGSARDPEVTGIIPVVNDDRISEHEQKLASDNEESATTVLPAVDDGAAAGTAAGATAGAASGATSGADAAEEPTSTDASAGGGSRPWYASFPTWAWILVIGVGLSVVGAATAVAMMNSGGDEERHSPYSSVVPSYPRPEAWDSSDPIPSAQPNNGAGSNYYYEPDYNEPEEYTPWTPDESDDDAPSSPSPSPSEQNPGDNGGNGGNTGGGNTGGNGGGTGGQPTPGDGDGGGTGGGNGGTGGGTGGGNTSPPAGGGGDGGGTGGGTGTGDGDGGGTGADQE